MRHLHSRNKTWVSPLRASVACCILSVTVVLLLSSGVGLAGEADPVEVRDLRHWVTEEAIRVVVDLSGPVEFTKGRLGNPERLVFDLKNAKMTKGLKTQFPVNDSLLKAVRLGQFNPTTARIVFDIGTAEYECRALNLEDPARLVIDLSLRRPKEEEPHAVPETTGVRRKIVLDPGHGGEDPGAVGLRGLYEKDVVLDIALKVRDLIRSDCPGCEVILTRDKDVFVPLPERTAIANRTKADLFISIHANASPRRQARGIETYLLNWTNDAESNRVAARENAISYKRQKQMQDEVGLILASLERELKRDESGRLARNLQNVLVSAVGSDHPSVPDLGVKQALFYVLVDARMPSALVEVSFISNPQEERLLSNQAYRKKIAQSIVRGINGYFSSVAVQKVAAGRDEARGSRHRTRTIKYAAR